MKSTTYEILKKNGFQALTPLEKLEKDLSLVEGELALISIIHRFFKENQGMVLDHPAHGTVTPSHNLLSRTHKEMLTKKESSLKSEIKKEKLRIKKEEMKGKLTIVENKGNIIPLFY